jgi:hypothetical protein
MLRLTSFFFLATIACCTFERVNWNVAGAVNISDVFAVFFLVSCAVLTRPRVPHTTVVMLGFATALLLVYLIGYFNLQTEQALAQFLKGLVKAVIHLAFLAFAITWLRNRGVAYYWRALKWFVGGMTFNAIYGLCELLVARGGGNLDALLLNPLTGGASKINTYGRVEGAAVYRTTALTGDPNHLAIFLIVPLLLLTPLYLRLEQAHRLKRRLGILIAFLLLIEVSTLSRSGLLGLAAGVVVLAVPYRGYLASKALIVPLVSALAVLAVVVITRLHYFEVIARSRFETNGKSESAHLYVYSFVPAVLHSHPLFGLGLNNFAVYYQYVTGLTNWGPHSFYVALLVETGLVGTATFAAFLVWVFSQLGAARRLGRRLTDNGDALGRRVRPLAWGWTAAIVGTMAANVFYLTMTFYYFYVMLALALAVPVVFAGSAVERPRASPNSLSPARVANYG